jgi:hypothetical protein
MHEPIRENLEKYLSHPGDQDLPLEFRAHMESCEKCRKEAQGMEVQARLLRVLRASEEKEPYPGFYARVVERIEVQRAGSIWNAFLEPVFVKRIVFASLALLILLTGYMVTTEPRDTLSASSPEVIMAVEPQQQEVVGPNLEQSRERVLATLASYRE